MISHKLRSTFISFISVSNLVHLKGDYFQNNWFRPELNLPTDDALAHTYFRSLILSDFSPHMFLPDRVIWKDYPQFFLSLALTALGPDHFKKTETNLTTDQCKIHKDQNLQAFLLTLQLFHHVFLSSLCLRFLSTQRLCGTWIPPPLLFSFRHVIIYFH